MFYQQPKHASISDSFIIGCERYGTPASSQTSGQMLHTATPPISFTLALVAIDFGEDTDLSNTTPTEGEKGGMPQ